jgi:tRNA nucleotidyltransferase (CCA-adding enzyme)
LKAFPKSLSTLRACLYNSNVYIAGDRNDPDASGIEDGNMPETKWEHFPHGADIGLRGIGATKAEAFEQAALALTAVVADPGAVISREAVEIACEATDEELLLVDWLNALVYEMATRKMLFGKFEIQIDGAALRAQAWGERIDVSRHEPAVEVKGATFTALSVRVDENGAWTAQCVVDV